MAFTTNGNMHRHMRIHEKELAGVTSSADPDSPHSSIGKSPRLKKQPASASRLNGGDGSGWQRILFDDGKRLKRKLQAVEGPSALKKICDGVVDLRQNKLEASEELAADNLSISLSQQVTG